VIARDDHRAVGIARIVGLEGAPPFGRVESAAEVLLDRQIEGLAMLVDGLKVTGKTSLLDYEGVTVNLAGK